MGPEGIMCPGHRARQAPGGSGLSGTQVGLPGAAHEDGGFLWENGGKPMVEKYN